MAHINERNLLGSRGLGAASLSSLGLRGLGLSVGIVSLGLLSEPILQRSQATSSLFAQPVEANPVQPNDGSTVVLGNCNGQCAIAGGERTGVNRFHSFTQFSVPDGATVAFTNNDAGVANAIARITGGDPTEIYGTLASSGAFPNFNLYLLNPSGLIVGPDATIAIGGAFVGSTADAVEFGSLGEWDTSEGGAPAGLTVHPSALLFKHLQSPGAIAIEGRPLVPNTAPDPQLIVGLGGSPSSLLLAGGSITVESSIMVALDGGNVNLAALGDEGGRVGLKRMGSSLLAADFSSNPGRGDITIANGSLLRAIDGGTISFRGENFTIRNNSFVGLRGDLQDGPPGDRSPISLDVSGVARFENFGIFFGDTSGAEDAAPVTIRAGETVLMDNVGAISSRTFGSGNGGRIDIRTNRLEMRDQSRIAADTGGTGDGGEIAIAAKSVLIEGTGSELIEDRTAINTFSLSQKDLDSTSLGVDVVKIPDNVGNAGTAIVRAEEMQLTNAGFIGTVSNTSGNAGSVDLQVTNRLQLSDRSAIEVGSFGSGDAGQARVSAGFLKLEDGSQISAESTEGSGGNIDISVDELLLMRRNSAITAAANRDGGDISIDAEFVVAGPNNNDITADAVRGLGGNIIVTSRGLFGLELRDDPSPQSSDISVSSLFTFNQVGDRDLRRELFEPLFVEVPADPAKLVNDLCRLDPGESVEDIGQFVYVGRGGLPLSPSDPLLAEMPHSPWVEREELPLTSVSQRDSYEETSQKSRIPLPSEPPLEIVEAQGLGTDTMGRVILTANTNGAQAVATTFSSQSCGAS